MATEPSAQRAYRAACPNCGAPVEFRSAASTFAVCSFCRSTVVREGRVLRRIGQSAELFDDHSPLQLGASGRYQGAAFTLVGRLQYGYADGTWNEWHALFEGDGGTQKSGWLSEDNGRHVIAFDLPLAGAAPAAESLVVGRQVELAGRTWSVASVANARLIAAQGELPVPPVLDHGFVVSDLRHLNGEVGTLDYAEVAAGGPVRWSVGRAVALAELALTGLAEVAEKTLAGRAVDCPNCGAALQITLATTRSIVCHQCRSVVDLTGGGQGVGADLQQVLTHYQQSGGREPLIPLGTVGALDFGGGALPWQVVGYVERAELPEPGDDGAEPSSWREYLLYNRTAGFAFLVDAEDGWSWVVPLTGAPAAAGASAGAGASSGAGDVVQWQGAAYRKLYDYTGVVTYVLGEFYWRVTQNQRTFNSDYQGTSAAAVWRLNREQTVSGDATGGTQEVVWSGGATLSAGAVVTAFGLAPAQADAFRRDAAPMSSNPSANLAKVSLWVAIFAVVFLLFRCDGGGGGDGCGGLRANYGEDSAEYQNCLNNNRGGGGFYYGTRGGAFGGYSSGGGGHK